MLPWTEEASALINFSVFATLWRPQIKLCSDSAFRLVDQGSGVIRSVAM